MVTTFRGINPVEMTISSNHYFLGNLKSHPDHRTTRTVARVWERPRSAESPIERRLFAARRHIGRVGSSLSRTALSPLTRAALIKRGSYRRRVISQPTNCCHSSILPPLPARAMTAVGAARLSRQPAPRLNNLPARPAPRVTGVVFDNEFAINA